MRIGLEVHVALPVRTKLFCGDLAYENQDEPNSNICPVCLGLPGSKPVLNKKALDVSASIANALNCHVSERTWFVRKVYFYPDLPKGYQITQLDGAVGMDGYVRIGGKKVRIRRVQIEEDPARITREKQYSLIDFNRSGVPLNEIVTEPDIESLEEMREFVEELRSILYYQGVNINQELKIDLNISLAENRVEIKNITGIKNLVSAAEYEIKRQSALIAGGKGVRTETRTYKEDSAETVPAREKETEEEYGFIFEPDLTFYDTSRIRIDAPTIASAVAAEMAVKNGYSEKTIRELVMFDKKNLQLLSRLQKDSFRKGIALIEKFASFGITGFSDRDFDRMLEYDVSLLDRESFVSLFNGEQPQEKSDKSGMEEEIRKMIMSDSGLSARAAKDEKARSFLIGRIKSKYHVTAKEAAMLIDKVIKGISNS